MSKMAFRISGGPEMVAKLRSIDKAINGAAQQALLTAVMPTVNRAKELAPYRTGTLRRSIASEPGPGKMEVTIGTDVEYAPYLEFGTSRMSPRPYLRPAIEETLPEIGNHLAKAIEAIIEGQA